MIGRRRRRVRHGPGPFAGPTIGPVEPGASAETPRPPGEAAALPLDDAESAPAAESIPTDEVIAETESDAESAPGAEVAPEAEAAATGDVPSAESAPSAGAAPVAGATPAAGAAPAAEDTRAAGAPTAEATSADEAETLAEQVWESEGGPSAPPGLEPGAGDATAGTDAAGAVGAASIRRPAWWGRVFDLRRARNAVAMLGLALLAFVTGLIVFNNVVMPRLVHSVSEQRIPDLTNLTVDQAEKNLSARGLALSRAGERFDPSVPRGFILSQDPPAETPIRGKKRVSVVVSLGEEFSSVPELFGESVRTAQYLLERAGLRLGGVTRAPSEEVGEGLVAASDPPAESVLPRDAPVSLLVSTGGGEERFVMPDVLGREIGGARRQLEAFGFRVSTPPAAPSVGTIVFQDPAPGASISRSTPIVLQATGRIIR